jgi:hypothetical protein
MRKFVESQGKINLNPKLSIRKEIQPQFVEQLNAKDESTMTPMELSKQRKARRAEQEFETLKKAAADARLNQSIGQSLKAA